MNTFVLNQESAEKIIASRKLITSEGKFALKVTSVQPYQHPKRGLLNIVNFNAMTQHHMDKAMELGLDDLQGALNQQMSASLRVGIDFIPVKGETVHALISNVELKEGGTGLFVTSISPMPVQETSTVSAFSFGKAKASKEKVPA